LKRASNDPFIKEVKRKSVMSGCDLKINDAEVSDVKKRDRNSLLRTQKHQSAVQ